jgi:hypothetical protein
MRYLYCERHFSYSGVAIQPQWPFAPKLGGAAQGAASAAMIAARMASSLPASKPA